MQMKKDIDWGLRQKQLQKWKPPSPELWPWLKEKNLAWGCSSQVLEAIDCLSQGAPVVVTGQQAGLLTGPLYTIYKAASAVNLARQLSQELETAVVPVFWLASEDHDFLEVRSAFFPAGAGKEVLFPGDYQLTPAAEIPLTRAAVDSVLQQLEEILPETEFTPQLFALVEGAAQGSFSDWCGGLLSRLFGQYGLVLLDSCGLPVRQAARPVFAQAIEDGEEIHRLLEAAGAAMVARGRRPGLDVPRQHSHLFLMEGGQRLALLRQGKAFADRNGTVALTQGELRRIVQEEPWRLSPNVALRPLVQELVVPVLAIIGGPGELAYLEQLRPVFTHFGLEQPPVLPRMGGWLLEPPIARLLERYGLEPGQDLDAWLQAALSQADSWGIPRAFARLREKIRAEYARITPGLAEIDSQLTQLGAKNLDKVMEQVDWLEARATAAHRRKHEDMLRQGQRLKVALSPRGQEQQRLHNVFWYFNKYGPALLAAIMEQPLAQDLRIYL